MLRLSGANVALQFGTYIAASDPTAPTTQTITLIKAPVITDTTLSAQNILLGQNTPFLFESPASANIVAGDKGPTPLTIGTETGQQTLLLHLLPRSVDATNADGSPGLDLSGSAKSQFPLTTAALSTDNELGAAGRCQSYCLQNSGRGIERHQCWRLATTGAAGLLAIRARCVRRHA